MLSDLFDFLMNLMPIAFAALVVSAFLFFAGCFIKALFWMFS